MRIKFRGASFFNPVSEEFDSELFAEEGLVVRSGSPDREVDLGPGMSNTDAKNDLREWGVRDLNP